jgi:hypothetical protein
MKNVRSNLRYWISGTTIALAGVVLSRLLAPHCNGHARIVATLSGQILALSGLFILCLGVRQRIQRSES